jgi:hypothetical protein
MATDLPSTDIINTIHQIITMDQEHSKFVLATGFNHFWRGKSQKERMYVSISDIQCTGSNTLPF